MSSFQPKITRHPNKKVWDTYKKKKKNRKLPIRKHRHWTYYTKILFFFFKLYKDFVSTVLNMLEELKETMDK